MSTVYLRVGEKMGRVGERVDSVHSLESERMGESQSGQENGRDGAYHKGGRENGRDGAYHRVGKRVGVLGRITEWARE